MKIYLPLSKDANTGKGFFIQRLSQELMKYVKVNNKLDGNYDIALHLTKIKEKVNARRHIIRYDGIYHNLEQDYLIMNSSILKHMKNAHGIVYQSEFSKLMCDNYLGKFKGYKKVIFNGADTSYYDNIKSFNFGNINFLAVSRWRPHKRLRDIIECFLLSNISNSILWVAGPLDKSGLTNIEIMTYKKNGIKFLGRINQELLAKYYVSCQASIHLCWLDWCPNSVVEAIAAKCIVISNNIGGTPELVSRSNGIICQIDKEYNYKPIELYKPPQFDRRIVAEAIIDSIKPRNLKNQFIDIKIITKQYLEFFEEVFK